MVSGCNNRLCCGFGTWQLASWMKISSCTFQIRTVVRLPTTIANIIQEQQYFHEKCKELYTIQLEHIY